VEVTAAASAYCLERRL